MPGHLLLYKVLCSFVASSQREIVTYKVACLQRLDAFTTTHSNTPQSFISFHCTTFYSS